MSPNQRKTIADFEKLVGKPVIFRGDTARVSSGIFRSGTMFFSVNIKGIEYDFEKSPDDLEVFMKRIIPVTKERIDVVVPEKKVKEKEPFGVKVYKVKGKPFYLVLSDDVVSIPMFKRHKYFSVCLPTDQGNLDVGRLVIIPSTHKAGLKIWKKRDNMVMCCTSYAEHIRYNKYDVSVGEFDSSPCLILTPDI